MPKEIIKKEVELYERLEGFIDEESRLDELRFAWIRLGKEYLREADQKDCVN